MPDPRLVVLGCIINTPAYVRSPPLELLELYVAAVGELELPW
jgi:hypothetical protein